MKHKIYFSLGILALLLMSCATPQKSMVLGDVIKFSDDVVRSYNYQDANHKNRHNKPYNLDLNSNKISRQDAFKERGEIMKFISDSTIGRNTNTAAIYAMDEACDRVKYIRKRIAKNDPDTKYYMVLLTDGLDNVSCQVAKNKHKGNYKNTAKYLSKWQTKMGKAMGNKKNYFVTYPCMYAGSDMEQIKQSNFKGDSIAFMQFLNEQLEGYRFASKGNSKPKAIIEGDMEILLNRFKAEFNKQNFEFHIPKGYVGKRVRMVIVDSLYNNKEYTIEGDFIQKGSKYILQDVEYKGMTINTKNSDWVKNGGKQLIAFNNDSKDALLAVFRINDLQRLGAGEKREIELSKCNVSQTYREGSVWMINSEYAKQAQKEKNAYIIIAIDGSESLGNMRKAELDIAGKIVNYVLQLK